MKKFTFLAAFLAAFTFSSCGTLGTSSSAGSSTGNILGSILGSATSGETVGNILGSVIGLDRVSQKSLYGAWHYQGPGCAFTSENLLAKAGGEIAAAQVREKLATQYAKLGLSSSNTYINFNNDDTFSAKIDGKSWSGRWTFDEKLQAVNFQGLLLNMKGYVKRSSNGISILFESKKVLTLLQTLASFSGNGTLSAIGDISKNYDGVRVGFEMRR